MNNIKVTVLTPHGRRQIMKITPSTTLLQILEGVCQKHDIVCDDYDLKHHNTIVDLSAMFRFSGLPNNCFLEMIEAKKKREDKDVVICIQSEDGSRVKGIFKSSANFSEVLEKLCPESVESKETPVLVYMRKELFGEDLAQTTLKSVGITASAIVRLLYRNPEDLKKQANVSIALPKTQPQIPDSIPPAPANKQVETQTFTDVQSSTSDLVKEETIKVVELLDPSVTPTVVNDSTESPPPSKKYDWNNSGEGKTCACPEDVPVDDTSSEEESINDAHVIELGERNAVLFSLAEAQRVTDEPPDSFFELTTDDLKLILKDLHNQANGSQDEPLQTSQMRAVQEQGKLLRRMAKYKSCVVRVHFPTRLALQGIFQPTETVQDIYNFVRNFLEDSTIDFHLFTTPPKKIPDLALTMIEADFLPGVVLHFGTEDKNETAPNYIKADLLDKLSSVNAASYVASKFRGQKSQEHVDSLETQPKKPKPDVRNSTATQSTQAEDKVPKWFKSFKK